MNNQILLMILTALILLGIIFLAWYALARAIDNLYYLYTRGHLIERAKDKQIGGGE